MCRAAISGSISLLYSRFKLMEMMWKEREREQNRKEGVPDSSRGKDLEKRATNSKEKKREREGTENGHIRQRH